MVRIAKLAGVVTLSCALAIVVGTIVLWLLPTLLTKQEGLTAPEQLKAMNDTRAPLVTFLVALGAAATLWFTRKTYLMNREGQVTDRYTKAVAQLGDENLAVRIGGVYALQRVASDSLKERGVVRDVLVAFVITESKKSRPRDPNKFPTDSQVALNSLAELCSKDGVLLDLDDADLTGAELSGIRPFLASGSVDHQSGH